MTPIAGTLSRRGFLRTSGRAAGGAIVLAAGGLGGRAWAQGVFGNLYAGPAFEPWRDWRRGRHQGSLGLVAAAILASNPHNSQPWLFRVGERHVELFADPSRHLGTIDPFRREMHLGLACALENIAVAARRLAYPPHVAVRPDPSRHAALAPADVNRRRDGVTTLAAGLPERILRLALILPARVIGDPGRAWLAATRDRHCRTASMFGLIAVRNPADVVQRLEAGRLWQRLHLEAISDGLAMQPLNQLMELAERDRVLGRSGEAAPDLARMVGDDRFQSVFGFRCGYTTTPA